MRHFIVKVEHGRNEVMRVKISAPNPVDAVIKAMSTMAKDVDVFAIDVEADETREDEMRKMYGG